MYYILGVLGPAAIVAWGMFRRTRLQAQRERAGRAEAVEQLRVEQIRYAERTRIAREMHDVLAHRISLLSLHAGVLEFRPDAPPEEVARAARDLRRSHPSQRSRPCQDCSKSHAPPACASGQRFPCPT